MEKQLIFHYELYHVQFAIFGKIEQEYYPFSSTHHHSQDIPPFLKKYETIITKSTIYRYARQISII